MTAKKIKQLVFHHIPYVQCTICNACGQRKRTKIICECCQQKVFMKDEVFKCAICGGEMREITAAEHDWNLHYSTFRQEDPDLDRVSNVKKPHLAEGDQPFATGRLETPPAPPKKVKEARITTKNKERPHTATKYCKCGAVIDREQTTCKICAWAAWLKKRSIIASVAGHPTLKETA